jgi:hypothetical protein
LPVRRALASLSLLALVVSLTARAQGEEPPAGAQPGSTKEDLGDTGAPPPTAEDLGRASPEPDPPPEPKKPRRRRDPADAGTAQPPPAVTASPTPPASGAAPKASPSAENSEKAAKLHADLTAALADEPGDARALEALAQAAAVDALIAIEPSIRPLVRLARARALLLQGRLDEAGTALGEARAAADAAAGPKGRAAAAQVRYRLAELEEARVGRSAMCGLELGLGRLATWEGKQRQDAVKRIASRYKSAAQVGDRFWARRAAYRTALLYEAHYRESLKPAKTLRGVRLPSPFTIGSVRTEELLADVVTGAWPAEIARLYSSVIGSVDARNPDPVLVELARKSAAELGRLTPSPGESAENPWLKDEHEELIRYLRRFEKRAADGSWKTVEPPAARKLLAASVDKGPGSVDFAYALTALAEASPPPPKEMILAALASEDPRTRLAGYIAAERVPDASFAAPILDRFLAAPAEQRKAPFSTLQGALYGEAERALLALRAIAGKNREVAEKLVADSRLPAGERAWLVAEVGDSRLAPALQSLAWNDDPVVASRAIFGIYVAQGRNGLGYARPQAEGMIGCVSKAVHAMDGTQLR